MLSLTAYNILLGTFLFFLYIYILLYCTPLIPPLPLHNPGPDISSRLSFQPLKHQSSMIPLWTYFANDSPCWHIYLKYFTFFALNAFCTPWQVFKYWQIVHWLSQSFSLNVFPATCLSVSLTSSLCAFFRFHTTSFFLDRFELFFLFPTFVQKLSTSTRSYFSFFSRSISLSLCLD